MNAPDLPARVAPYEGAPAVRARAGLLGHALSAVRLRPSRGVVLVAGAALHAAGHAFLAAAAGLLVRVLAGGQPMVLGSSHARFDVTRTDAVLLLAFGGLLAAFAKLVGGALASWAEARIAGDVASAVRLGVLEDVLAVEGHRAESHDRLAALTTHVQEVERGVAGGVLGEVRSAMLLLPLAAILVVLAPKLASSAVVALALFGVMAFALRRTFKRAHDRAASSAAALVAAADEAVKHAELWATYGAKGRIRAHVARASLAIAHEAADLRVRASLLSSTSEVLGALALVLVLVLASRGALGVDHATVVPFAIAFFMAYRPLRDLVEARLARARGEAALAAAQGAFVTRRAEVRDAPATATTWSLEPLVLRDVRVGHGAFRPLSLSVSPGTLVAVVGPTGIGKTSLLRALLGLEPLAEGQIAYGDHVLDRAGVGPAARPFAWVPQDAPVVADTLAVNVGLGRPDGANDEDDEDASALLDELGAGAFASALGKETVLAAGRAVSGGERQWIAVARALATGLPVLLLDEPTSALDGHAQARILDAVARLKHRRTVILVTHRPEPLAVADVVVRLEAEPGLSAETGRRASAQD